ncbi:hypothetical protein FIM02_01790 [SAR202 cluster bacterium AD-802-E10_MRT_200m]|nr:hypothetical protein [SAR202 cluster bacterium AD-802-E10_MRT_200m]
MEFIFGALLALVIPILIVSGIVYLIIKLKSTTPFKFSFRAVLRVYFYIVLLVSIGLTGPAGLATLLNVGFGEVIGREFSYGEVYSDHYFDLELRNPSARSIEFESQSDTGSIKITENQSPEFVYDSLSLSEKVELRLKEDLITGLSLIIIGSFIFLIHQILRSRFETKVEQSDITKKCYLFCGLFVFSVVSIVQLADAIPETLRYLLLEVHERADSPGSPLSVAFVSIPIWIYFLITTLSIVRRSSTN